MTEKDEAYFHARAVGFAAGLREAARICTATPVKMPPGLSQEARDSTREAIHKGLWAAFERAEKEASPSESVPSK